MGLTTLYAETTKTKKMIATLGLPLQIKIKIEWYGSDRNKKWNCAVEEIGTYIMQLRPDALA